MKQFHFFFILFLLLSPVLVGQTPCTYNCNIYNGLRSNHIYGVITDRHGYLWIATPKGVARYNGYEFRHFGIADGLPKDDIWQVLEDREGRVWICSTSDEIGYLSGDKYHKAFLRGIRGTVSPKDVRASANGIVFVGPYMSDGKNGQPTICVTKGDTVFSNRLYERYFLRGSTLADTTISHGISLINSAEGKTFFLYNRWLYNIDWRKGVPYLHRSFRFNDDLHGLSGGKFTYLICGDYIVYYSKGSTSFTWFDVRNGSSGSVVVSKYCKDDTIKYVYCKVGYGQEKELLVITSGKVLRFNCAAVVMFKQLYNLHDLLGNYSLTGDDIFTFYQDAGAWGNCIGSTADGLYINHNLPDHFKQHKGVYLAKYTSISDPADNYTFWWNAVEHGIYTMYKDGHLQCSKIDNIGRVSGIKYIGNDVFFINGTDGAYWFNNKTNVVDKADIEKYGDAVYASIKDAGGNDYVISPNGIYIRKKADANGLWLALDNTRYEDLAYDSLRNRVLAYCPDKLFIHGTGEDTAISKRDFGMFGITSIEKIIPDNNYGNIIFKGNNNLTIYDPEKNISKIIFVNINLAGGTALIYRNTLIAAGSFGIAFSKILGKGSLSAEVIYPNVKNLNYSYVYGAQAYQGTVYLNTDKGLISVSIPSDSEIINSCRDSTFFMPKFIFKYGDSICNFKNGDTLMLSQPDRRLQFDVINPYGNGILKFAYQFAEEAAWHELNANELTLAHNVEAGRYYRLYLKAHDEAWNSDPVQIYVFIRPYWYQTVFARRMLWLCGGLLFLVLLAITVLITRRLVTSANKKKSELMELELKSIYAQLNPHFVFNTLNGALTMIKKERLDDAFVHISKFSKLLRSYLDSSKNRYISLKEEIVNIRNYIELQQNRFPGMFTYEVVVGDVTGELGSMLIPGLLLQPLVENAINHGLLPKEKDGHLKLEFNTGASEHEIICIIDDNGIGRHQSRLINKNNSIKSTSLGEGLINDLVAITNKYGRMHISIQYIDKQEPHTGTTVVLTIKNNRHDKI